MISEDRVLEEYRRRYQNPDVARQYASEVSSRDPRAPRQLRNLIARIVTGAEQAAIASMMARLPIGGTILFVPPWTGKGRPGFIRSGRGGGADPATGVSQ